MVSNGRLMRIDRLVRRGDTGDWWVLDYKSESNPQANSELLVQLRNYRLAVQKTQAQSKVRVAFLSANGMMIELHE